MIGFLFSMVCILGVKLGFKVGSIAGVEVGLQYILGHSVGFLFGYFGGVAVGLALTSHTMNTNTYVYNINFFHLSRNDHTTMTAPLPVCSAKLSIVGPG